MENKTGDRLLNILEYVIIAERPLRLIEVAKGMGINSSTALRYLNTLVLAGYVEQNPESLRYQPTYKIQALANHINLKGELRNYARPVLEKLAEMFGESVCMSVEQNMRAVYIDTIRSIHSLSTFQEVGGTSPMHCTGNGKVLMLNYTEEQIDEYIELRGLKKYTDHTITDKETLMNELAEIREKGFARDREEREYGVSCLSFPVYNYKNEVIAGISVTGPKERMAGITHEERFDEARQLVDGLSERFGYKSVIE